MTRVSRLLEHRAVGLAGPLVGLACAGVFLAGLDVPAVGDAFVHVDWRWLAPMLLLGCVNLWLRAARWGVLLAPTASIPTIRLLGIGVAAALAGLGLPARGGDAVKMVLASRLPGIAIADVAAAELFERLVDGAIFGAFIVGAAHLAGVDGWPLSLGLGALAIHLPILATILLAGRYLGASPDVIARPVWDPRRLIALASEAARRRGGAVLARAARLSLLAWATEALSYYCLLVAFGWLAPPTLPFAAVGVANFAFAVPGAPAGVGTFHMPVSSLLADSFGAEPGLADAFAVVLHVAVLAPVPLLWALLHARTRLWAQPVRAA